MRKTKMPTIEPQTIQPTKHLSRNIYANEITTAKAIPTRSHIQLFSTSVMKSAKWPCLSTDEIAVDEDATRSLKPVENTAAVGTHTRPNCVVLGYPRKSVAVAVAFGFPLELKVMVYVQPPLGIGKQLS